MKYPILTLIAIVVSLIIFSQCARFTSVDLPDKTLIEKVYVERTEDGAYVFTFIDNSDFNPYTIYKGNDPENINWTDPILTDSINPLVLTGYDLSKRFFFGIQNEAGERLIASERLIALDGASNFRDLGGIPTSDGRVIKWGTLYRSGKLSGLSDDDLQYFKTLGIKTVIDFRDDEEIREDPNRYPNEYVVNPVRVPIGDESGNMQRELRKTIKKANPDNFNTEEFVADVMRQFIDTFAYQYQPFINYVADAENTPLLFHCSAGKDRTGLAAALVFSILGVDKEVIMGEYLMSNYYRNRKINKTLRKATLVGVDQRIVQPLVEVKSSYLAAAFEAIDQRYGSMDNFLEVEYGLTQNKIERIRDKYLMDNTENVEKIVSEEELDDVSK